MGRAPCCEKVGLRRGRWTGEEDEILVKYIQTHGEGSWRSLPKNAGLLRCGKSCRLRWINYLRTDLKRGKFSAQEEDLIIKLHTSLGNRWSLIAAQLPGRTDNEIKNYWNSHLSRRIDTFLRPHNDAPIVIMNLSKLSNGFKRKTRKLTSKTNNEEMSKKGHSEVTLLLQETQTTTIKSTRSPCDTPLVSQETQRDAPDESIDLEAHGLQVETPDLVVKSHCQDSEEKVSVPKVLIQNMMNACGEVPHEGLHINSVVCPSGIKESNEVWTFSEKKEKEVMGCCEERESGVIESNKRTVEEGESGGGGGDGLSSNGETCELYSSSSMNSCFGDEWVSSCVVGDEWIGMDWDSMLDRHLPWEGGELLTWLEEFHC